jgi:hypothetical protein
MSSVGLLIFFALVGAYICAKARVAGGAIAFALLGLILFVSTPVGSGLPGAISTFLHAVDNASTPALTHRAGAQP